MPTIHEINDPVLLEGLRQAWNALVEQMPGADFFHTLDWLLVYWRHYGRGQRLRVLVVEDAGKTTGIVPLAVMPEATRLGEMRVLTYPLSAWGSFYGPIAADPQAALEAALRHVSRTPRDWDYLELRWVLSRTQPRDAVFEASAAAGLPTQRRADEFVPQIDMRPGWEAYWQSRTAKWRTNCRRNEKKAARAGRLTHVRYRPRGQAHGDDDPRWDLYDVCEQIAQRSWQGSSDTGTTISHAQVRAFLRDAHAEAVRAGAVDVNLLLIDDVPAAFEYNYAYRGYVSSLRRGFDPAFGAQGVGTTLMYRMLEDGFQRGDHTFDFLPGSLEIKKYWQTAVETSWRYSHYPRANLRAQALRLKRWLRPGPGVVATSDAAEPEESETPGPQSAAVG